MHSDLEGVELHSAFRRRCEQEVELLLSLCRQLQLYVHSYVSMSIMALSLAQCEDTKGHKSHNQNSDVMPLLRDTDKPNFNFYRYSISELCCSQFLYILTESDSTSAFLFPKLRLV